MADPYRITDDWQDGYDSGYDTGYFDGMKRGREQRMNMRTSNAAGSNPSARRDNSKKATTSRPQKGKAKVLTNMTAPVWKKYKKGRGKKTYVEIRAQVSKSQAYRRKVKGMK